MNNHKNARLTVFGRQLLVQRILQQGLRFEEAAHAAGVRTGTAYKWLTRYRQEGPYGLYNRSSRSVFRPHAIDDLGQQRCIELHKQRQIYRHISQSLGIGHSSVARILQRMGLTRLANLEPAPSVQRYEHEKPEDLLHLDIRRLGRFHRATGDRCQDSPGAGWEYVHVAVDDHSRVALVSFGYSLTMAPVIGRHASRSSVVAWDSSTCKPYTPQSNGKAERFIQTALRESNWAIGRSSTDWLFVARRRWGYDRSYWACCWRTTYCAVRW